MYIKLLIVGLIIILFYHQIQLQIREDFRFYTRGEGVVTPLINPNPNLRIAVSFFPEAVLPGQKFIYTLTLTNQGNLVAENIIMVNRIPEYVSFVSSERGTYRRGYVTWRRIKLNPGQSYQGKYTVQVDEDLDIDLIREINNDAYYAYNVG